jgi:hypothetical protein
VLLDLADIDIAEIEEWLAGIPTSAPGMTRNQISDLWKVANPRKRIEQLLNKGRLVEGEPVKVRGQWAKRYYAKTAVVRPTFGGDVDED